MALFLAFSGCSIGCNAHSIYNTFQAQATFADGAYRDMKQVLLGGEATNHIKLINYSGNPKVDRREKMIL